MTGKARVFAEREATRIDRLGKNVKIRKISTITVTITEQERKSLLQLAHARPASRASLCYPTRSADGKMVRISQCHLLGLHFPSIRPLWRNLQCSASFPSSRCYKGGESFRRQNQACHSRAYPVHHGFVKDAGVSKKYLSGSLARSASNVYVSLVLAPRVACANLTIQRTSGRQTK